MINELIESLEIDSVITALVFIGVILYGIFLLHFYWVLVDLIQSFIDAIASIRRKKNANKQKETM